jgi:hypothetical protein
VLDNSGAVVRMLLNMRKTRGGGAGAASAG